VPTAPTQVDAADPASLPNPALLASQVIQFPAVTLPSTDQAPTGAPVPAGGQADGAGVADAVTVADGSTGLPAIVPGLTGSTGQASVPGDPSTDAELSDAAAGAATGRGASGLTTADAGSPRAGAVAADAEVARTGAGPTPAPALGPGLAARQAARAMLAAAMSQQGGAETPTAESAGRVAAGPADSSLASSASATASAPGGGGAAVQVQTLPADSGPGTVPVTPDQTPASGRAEASADSGGQHAARVEGSADQAWASADKMPATPSSTPVFVAPTGALPGESSPAASPAAEASSVPAPQPGAGPATTDQVVQAVSLAWHGDVGQAQMRLTPEHLGEVTVSLHVEKGLVTAEVQATTPAARDWIQSHEQDLRDGLAQQGLQLDRLVVTADGQRQGQQDGGQPRRRPAPPPQSSEDAPQFEVDA
jgi:flagellar hook-length control protein FliK